MNSDADRFWGEIAPQYRKLKGLCPMTYEEADAAFDDAPEISMSDDEVQEIVDAVVRDETADGESGSAEWSPDSSLRSVEEDLLAVFREEGETDPDTDAKEEELRKRMLSDEASGEDGMDGGAAPSGEGVEDG